jgi:hypothetical protein
LSHILQEVGRAGDELFSVASSLRTGLIGGLQELQKWEANGPSTVVISAKKASRESFAGSFPHTDVSISCAINVLEEAFSLFVADEINGKAPLQNEMVSLRERNSLATGMSAEGKKLFWIALVSNALRCG